MSCIAPAPGTAVEVKRLHPHTTHFTIDRGVILHPAITWLVAFFPGTPEQPADPSDHTSIRVVRTGVVTGYRDLVDCDPEWLSWTWNHLTHIGPGFLQAPQAIRTWELAAELARQRRDATAAALLNHEQLEQWAGRRLTHEDVDQIATVIPFSTVPAAIGAIVEGIDSRTGRARPQSDPSDRAGSSERQDRR